MKMKTQDLASHTASRLNGEQNLYRQVALRISELIEHGTLRPGERVPSVRKCSAQQSVSIATVTQAYRVLEDRGMIEGRPQSGYYVRAQRWSPPPEPEMTRPPLRAINVETSTALPIKPPDMEMRARYEKRLTAPPAIFLEFRTPRLHPARAASSRRARAAARSQSYETGTTCPAES